MNGILILLALKREMRLCPRMLQTNNWNEDREQYSRLNTPLFPQFFYWGYGRLAGALHDRMFWRNEVRGDRRCADDKRLRRVIEVHARPRHGPTNCNSWNGWNECSPECSLESCPYSLVDTELGLLALWVMKAHLCFASSRYCCRHSTKF